MRPNTSTKHVHQHDTVEGSAQGHGPRTKLFQVHPSKICEQIADIPGTHLGTKVLNCDNLLVNHVIDATMSDQELGSVHRHLQDVFYQESHAPCQATPHHKTTFKHEHLLTSSVSPLPVKDYSTHQLMILIDSLAKGKELLLHLEGYVSLTTKLTN